MPHPIWGLPCGCGLRLGEGLPLRIVAAHGNISVVCGRRAAAMGEAQALVWCSQPRYFPKFLN
jgi:L-cysteine desulfidase